ncbi:hypothetical protein B0T16DRAFT_333103 [Cercophora newfieldiana]|uniref:AAA+ ATPase domain-containing protein n=1 Tax=Cercophora newfieldiana TaxID=92897 RepID=A0AA39Y131_9PEZI|nr:hypothetical protein B0T16DRAFT_333103 [Cercophora newfieldiana]
MLLNSHLGALNHDHVAPFRSILPLEKAIRRRHRELEDDLAQANPGHFAVRRRGDYLPAALTYIINQRPGNQEDACKDEVDLCRVKVDGFRALVHLLDTDLRLLVENYRRVQQGTIQSMPFSHLWFLFSPGQEIVSARPRHQAFRVLQVTGGRRSMSRTTLGPDSSSGGKVVSDLMVDCFHFDFDGKRFGIVSQAIAIKPYNGVKRIIDLPVYPTELHRAAPDDKHPNRSLGEVLLARGHKFNELCQVSHRRYCGLSLREPNFQTIEEIDSDVVIDFEVASIYAEAQSFAITPRFSGGVIEDPTIEAHDETYETLSVTPPSEGERPWISYDDYEIVKLYWTRWSRSTPLLRTTYTTSTPLPDEVLRLLPGRVYGYVLLTRKWYPLDIDLVEAVPRLKPGEKDGFEKLVLPRGHREIVRALVKTHARKAAGRREVKREFDVVRGKGRGLIILLHGSPGVGKTSTAECVAANAGRPLFPITCGDLGGDTAQEIEENLERFFNLARKWNCVLLLDEADVFLSARVAGNIKQNSLVSVFLRVLEYYSGILILTTNRVGSFDEAIKSRVHCALYYPPLDEEQTFKIWQMNLAALEERNETLPADQRVRFRRAEIEEFARRHWRSGSKENRWNGRQIKNAFQTAVALADWDHLEQTEGLELPIGPLLRRDHFKKVAKASRHFDQYLERVRRSDYSRAVADEIRDDEIRNELHSDGDQSHTDTEKKKQSKRGKKVVSTGGTKAKNKRKSKPLPESESEPQSEESSEEESLSETGSDAHESEELSSEAEEVLHALPTPPPTESSKKKKKAKPARSKKVAKE